MRYLSGFVVLVAVALVPGCHASEPPPRAPAPADNVYQAAEENSPELRPRATTLDVALSPAAGAPYPQRFIDAAKLLADKIQKSPAAWDRLTYLCDIFGPRLSGSEALEKSIDWAIETLKQTGIATARREKVMVPHWVRGAESARLVAPFSRELVLLGLGGTFGTGARGVTAAVVVVHDLEELEQRSAELKDRIVLINQRMPPYDAKTRHTGYGETVQIRGKGASKAARHGAKAVLIRSVTAYSLRTPHTGAVNYADDAPKIPAAALSPSDADFLERMALRGPASVELKLGAKTLPDAVSANVVAEIPGRELPNEFVVFGGHIDSWDVGQGAHDDGAGVIMAMRAAELLYSLKLIPRRTLRVVLFTNEENGLRGSRAYFEAHGHEKHVAALEADTGGGPPQGFGIGKTEADVEALLKYAPLFQAFGATDLHKGGGGADIGPLIRAGVLGFSLDPDVSHYFDYHHTPADMVDAIDPWDLERNAAAMALMVYILAERD